MKARVNFGRINENSICPACKTNRLGQHPAVSRSGSNNTLICAECGEREAMLLFCAAHNLPCYAVVTETGEVTRML